MPPEASLVSPHERSLSACLGLYTAWPWQAVEGLTARGRRADTVSASAPSGRRGSGLIQRGQHLGGVALRVHLRPDPNDPTSRPNQEAGPDDPPVGLAVVGLLAPGAIRAGDGMILICEERKRQPVLGSKRGLASGALRAQAPDGSIGVLEGGIVVAECAGLLGAAGRVVGRVEIDNGEVASTFGEAMSLPRVVAELEIGGELSHLRHGAHALRLAAADHAGISGAGAMRPPRPPAPPRSSANRARSSAALGNEFAGYRCRSRARPWPGPASRPAG